MVKPDSPITDKEREALSLLVTHRYYKAVANELGISSSAVKQRLASATRKLGARDPFEAARIIGVVGGAPYPSETGPFEQVEAETLSPSSSLTAAVEWFGRRMGGTGGRVRLSRWQRAAIIGVLAVVGLAIFVATMAVMDSLGRFGLQLKSNGIRQF